MKDIQQHLLIEDLDYCNTACDETEEIVGGGFWKAVKKTVRDKANAVKEVFHSAGNPDGETVATLLEPTPVAIVRNWVRADLIDWYY